MAKLPHGSETLAVGPRAPDVSDSAVLRARVRDDPGVTATARRLVSFRVGWLLIAVGLVLGIAAAIVLVIAVGPAFKDALVRAPCATPCSEVLDLDAGTYLVFEEIGRSTRVGPFSSTTQGPTTVSPADVTVTSPTGRALDVSEPGSSESINRNGGIYAGAVSFHVAEPGRYRVVVDSASDTRILVAPGLGQTFIRALPGIGAAAIGFAVGLTGLVLLIIAWSRRRTTP